MSRPERVLVEHADAATRWSLERQLRRQGYEVVTCPGPADHRYGRCPMLQGKGCEKVERADRVLNGVPGRAGDQLMHVQRDLLDTKVARLDPAPLRSSHPLPPDRLHLLAALDDALRRRGRPAPHHPDRASSG